MAADDSRIKAFVSALMFWGICILVVTGILWGIFAFIVGLPEKEKPLQEHVVSEDSQTETPGELKALTEEEIADGIHITYHEDGKTPYIESNYKDGKPDGLRKIFSKKGTLLRVDVYREGKRQGKSTIYYEDAAHPRAVIHFENDQPVGTGKIYYEDGSLMAEEQYKNGKHSRVTQYFPTGEVKAEISFEAGVPISQKRFYKSGALWAEDPYQNGKRHGITKAYYETGELAAEITVVNGAEADVKVYGRDGNVINPSDLLPKPAAEPKDQAASAKPIRESEDKKI